VVPFVSPPDESSRRRRTWSRRELLSVPPSPPIACAKDAVGKGEGCKCLKLQFMKLDDIKSVK
jgi:hypothetical protein